MQPRARADLVTFLVSLALALLVRVFLVEPRFIPSLSMYPTLEVGDQLTVDKVSKQWREFKRGDVVVFRPPPSFFQVQGAPPGGGAAHRGEVLIKRIVAVEGDVVQVKGGGVLHVNGQPQPEGFTKEKARYDFGPVTVPADCVFVLGDNRNSSLDGHIWGFLPTENIIGRATLRFWPPRRFGATEAAPP